MKKLIWINICLCISFVCKAQNLEVQRITDWNSLKYPGFFESQKGVNTPGDTEWYWGVNLSHIHNLLPDGGNHGAQILFPVSFDESAPQMYIRTTNHNGKGLWSKVLHDQGTQTINGDIKVMNNIIFPEGKLISPYPHDTFEYKGRVHGHYAIQWNNDSWSGHGPTLWQSAFGGIKFFTLGQMRMAIHANGNVGIGTENPKEMLEVAGKIKAKEVQIDITAGADHVFSENYKLRPLSEVKEFINENKHLPEIPSEKQMQQEGLNMNEFQIKLLQKIEELTLYVIDQKKEIDDLKNEVEVLRKVQ